MAQSDLTGEQLQEALDAVEKHGNVSAAARAVGMNRVTFQHRYQRAKAWKANGGQATTKTQAKSFTVEEDGDKRFVHSVSDKVRTLDDAIAKANVDLAVWEVERFVVNSWEVGSKSEDKSVRVTPLWQVKVWLRRKVSKSVEAAAAMLAARIEKAAPKYPRLAVPKVSDPHLLEICLYDVHFGKLAWAALTGTNYDLNITKRVFVEAARDLLAKARGYPIDRIVLPIGQDFLHIDGIKSETANGTKLDADGRYEKIFETAAAAMVELVESLAGIAPVELPWVPGNHDRNSSYALAQFVKAWFRNSNRVTVDVSPSPRKYTRYGCNLIGYTHGDTMPLKSLPLIMAGARPRDWAEATHREWHTGHLHKMKEMEVVSGDSNGPVRVRIIPSLSATDAWHHENGFVHTQRSAEAYLWSFTRGYAGHLSTDAVAA